MSVEAAFVLFCITMSWALYNLIVSLITIVRTKKIKKQLEDEKNRFNE